MKYHNRVKPEYGTGREAMNYAYRRMSTGKQDGEGQRGKILEWSAANGVKIDRWVSETVSSRKHRSERDVSVLVSKLEAGDMVLVSELSRLARSMGELVSIVQEVRERGASIAVADSGKVLTPEDDWQTDLYLMGMSVAAQIEREMVSQRTKAALQARKEAGMKLGRPKGSSKLRERDDEIARYLKLGINKADIAKLLGVARSTLYAYLEAREGAKR